MVWIVLRGARVAPKSLEIVRILHFYGLGFALGSPGGPIIIENSLNSIHFHSFSCVFVGAGGPRIIGNASNSTFFLGLGCSHNYWECIAFYTFPLFGFCFGERGSHSHWKCIEVFTFPSFGCDLRSAGGPIMIGHASNSIHFHGFGSALGARVAPESLEMH